MARLFILVEGETEETFVNELLADHLCARGFLNVSAKLMGNARLRSKRGGVKSWPSVRTEIVRHLRSDPEVFVSTMVDYYGMPSDGDRGWPGRRRAASLPFAERAISIERELIVNIGDEIGDARRFIPFVVMHEFEAYLFSDCGRMATAIGQDNLGASFQAIRDSFGTPEEINDSPSTHPSRRILAIFPGYEKPLFGNLAALEIGLERIRAECPHFRAWLERLEGLL
ncbi:hypothetical protein OJF2_14570 [Aquisphaera giovannonii]|uniref:DUF4276 domain-containing protein n=1 Tax=Aquisphaera giovannonii TaxID=406548 RepID=A0A5B9VYZ4_9BACT|nr:DUF4276 family protein [Aquisphaera giovannonii]QEH32965.1 hypothetical protein OJF2_14570 [Aquisphaera giovannonii]